MAVSSTRQPVRGQALAVTAGVMVANASGYVLTVVAARVLNPAAFGELGALLAVLLVGAVPAMGLQTHVALKVAADPDRLRRPVVGLGLAVAGAVTAVAGVAVPIAVPLLRVPDVGAVVWLALCVGPLTLNGLWHGLLQGDRRYALFGALVALEAVGRVGGALIALAWTGTTAGTLAGAALGTALSTTVGWLACGRPGPGRFVAADVREVLHAGQALLAVVVLVNLDLLLARHVLPAAASGEYAVGAVLTKIAYWLPHAVAVTLLPRLAREEGSGRALGTALAVCAGLDSVVVLGAALFGSTATRLIGGPSYVDSVLPLWAFAVAGTLLALAQMLLYARIAGRDRKATLLVWLAVVVEVGLVMLWLNDSPGQTVAAAVVATALLVGSGFVVEARSRFRS
ncbi:lipopolysaccharide biosynthesis protein [Saccharothrix variisporea]|uniref:O-antigen/teichoic acid export membrane protein n=1 Tax=Saccharothrix variisporea TaxID=543527 RepID=A0A495XHN2_9PSEU|nr:polysaccharide biosynthesis protein [Saccharothrix variisporea]RKT72676.1 O-antigen/teichoic acid export membrane protein [Saccharothrix variisporea]